MVGYGDTVGTGVNDGGPVENVVTSGKFELDGGSWDVDNNVWILGDSSEVVVIDAAHDAQAIRKAVGDRNVTAILCTHSHNDHVNAAPALSKALDAPILLNPEDRVVWNLTHPDLEPDGQLEDGETFTIAGIDLKAIHTPGHSPGSTCFYAPDLGVVFTGDTLFQGGPGATGRSYSDYGVILESIERKLFSLPDETIVRTGHGDHTKIGDEAPHLEEWKAAKE
ncbi:MBL fold metallo-hydrolase [Actinomycetospora chiangmaiensis]|uniref:MBL fold metallo-hydrolase n=1 Tax=Actinomycetospora chiangmaiensis TaxID=402650 RepID=UPI0003639959|nr:MBL fold metallo-hydrolase [Actinomycetospora chiangmaiensis]